MNRLGLIFKLADYLKALAGIIFRVNYEFFNSSEDKNFCLIPIKVRQR